ncbi:MAG: segregation/condensation protein A [Armatimonadetes bacterium]|nr:segregation/condensation protein A [Armatimonadota bacterium]NIM23958.1 segregation/condensation protein A [Armatimonadota bacterium]NIM67805.1 segregation/condensation protein A [Armatimonadota bacterium]NIM76345.1 segregation/condensation protein A [Armatimonadota bacterium]NIN06039.1 segregation/condensation protein A [Armatimonadota bacterium]
MTVVVSQPTYEIPEGRVFLGHPVKLPVFEGPLDLLLYLIRREEIDIYDIPIATITEQYLGYLALMETYNIEVAGDFLVMAATLMEIKSRCLLPKPEVTEETEEEEDPRAELIARLLEYRRYKEAATTLDDLATENRFVLSRPPLNGNGNGNGNGAFVLAGDVSAFRLWAAFQEVLSRAPETAVGEVIKPRFTVTMKIAQIAAKLRRATEGLSFFSLFPEGVTKLEVIVTFLALLELIRQRRVRITQPETFGDILLLARNPA